MTGRERDAVMPGLRVWVDRLADRFALDTRVIPPCWEQHNGIVEGLSALRDHERGSYAADADPRAGVDWLRALREVRALLTEQAGLTQCSVHQHRDPAPRRPLSQSATQPASARSFAAAEPNQPVSTNEVADGSTPSSRY